MYIRSGDGLSMWLLTSLYLYLFLSRYSLEDGSCWLSDHQGRGIMLHSRDIQTQSLSRINDPRYALNYRMEGKRFNTKIKRNVQTLGRTDWLWDSETSESQRNLNTCCRTELCTGQWRRWLSLCRRPSAPLRPAGVRSDTALMHTCRSFSTTHGRLCYCPLPRLLHSQESGCFIPRSR